MSRVQKKARTKLKKHSNVLAYEKEDEGRSVEEGMGRRRLARLFVDRARSPTVVRNYVYSIVNLSRLHLSFMYIYLQEHGAHRPPTKSTLPSRPPLISFARLRSR